MDYQTRLAATKKNYTESTTPGKAHILVTGVKGIGKTSLLKTCPAPVLVHSFDPGGTEVLIDEIKADSIIADTRFEYDEMMLPKAYTAWEKEYNELVREGFFEHIGTYCIDSLTTFADCVLWQIMNKEGRIPAGMNAKLSEGQGMRRQDWGTLLNTFIMLGRKLGRLPCHTIMFGHIGKELDAVTGQFVRYLALPGKSKDKLPVAVSEVYVLRENAAGKRVLQTAAGGGYIASTRMGRGGLFNKEEEPDIRVLLEKAGYDWEDKG